MDIDRSYDYNEKSVVNRVLNLITIVGCIFSIVCLFLALIVFSCLRSLKTLRYTCHRNLCFCLLLAELVFVIGIDRTDNKVMCRVVAVALHYLFLAAFCWMLLEGYQLYVMLIQVFENDEIGVLIYYLYAYGFPAVIVAVTAGLAWPNYGTDQYCWLNVETPTIWAFAGPTAVVIVSNIVFLAVALRVVLSVHSHDRSYAQKMLGWLKGSATLLCLLGITWIFGYLMVIQGTQIVFAYIFTIFNCLQGVFIFVLHVVLNDKFSSTVLGSHRALMKMMTSHDLSFGSSKPSTQSSGLRITEKSNKELFAQKTLPQLNGSRNATALITYLDWKTKVSSESGSIPTDDSGNSTETMDQSRKNSGTDNERHFMSVRRKTRTSENGSKPESNRTSNRSIIIERF